MIYIAPTETVKFGFLGPTGLTGSARVRIVADGATVTAATTSGITEFPASSGAYQVNITAPSDEGFYLILVDDGSATPDHLSAQELTVTSDTAIVIASSGQDYITESELKAAKELAGYTYADGQIPNVITAASRVVDRLCGTRRRFYADADANQVRYYTADDSCKLEIDDLITLTTLATDNNGDGTYEVTWATTDYKLNPLNAAADSWPYERIKVAANGRYRFPRYEAGVKITGQFGWLAVPAEVWTATSILAVRYLLRVRESPAGIVVVGGMEGSMMRLARTDPDVPGLLERFSRKRILA